MELSLGGIETIVDPSLADVRHYLKFMPVESPFVILSDGDRFMQSIYDGTQYRVEYRHGNEEKQYYCLTDYEKTCELFAEFLSGSDDYETAVDWNRVRPKTIWNTQNHPAVLIILCVLVVIGTGAAIWNAFN